MTDEERQKKLCDALRNTHPSRMMCKDAADEIERLVEQVAWWANQYGLAQQEIERLGRLIKYLESKLEDLERRHD